MTLTPELLEKFRQTGIRLDRNGQFWHDGAVVEHRGLHKALLRWLDILPDGRPILRLDETRYAYLEVDDAHLLAVSARLEGSRIFLAFNDGSSEELAYDSLRVAPDNALYCSARAGLLRARITTAAYFVVAEKIVEDSGKFILSIEDRLFPIRPL